MNIKYFLTVFTSIIETACLATVVFGWSSLDFIFTNEQYFKNACKTLNKEASNKTQSIKHCQQYNLELIYTLAATIGMMSGIVWGLMLDHFGTWSVRILASILFILGSLMVSFSYQEISWILYPAFILIAISGIGIYTSNIQVANLYPRYRGLIVNLINGALIAGNVVGTDAKSAYQSGISLKAIFLFLTFLGMLAFIRSFFLMPKRVIPHTTTLPNNYYYGIKECCLQSSTENENEYLLDDTESAVTADEENNKMPELSLKLCILTSIYLLGLYSSTVQELRVDYFIEALNSWLQYLIPNNPGLISFQLSFFGYSQYGAFLLTPINGLIFDTLLHHFRQNTNLSSKQANLRSLSVVCFICSSSTILYSMFNLISLINLQYVTFILTVVSNSFVSANLELLVLQCFPMKHFGTLVGIAIFFWALATPLQYLLYYIAMHFFNGNFLVVNVIMLVVSATTLLHPLNLYRCSRKKSDSV